MDFFSLQEGLAGPLSTKKGISNSKPAKSLEDDQPKHISKLTFDPTKVPKSFVKEEDKKNKRGRKKKQTETIDIIEEDNFEEVQCNVCGKVFHRSSSFKLHMKLHEMKNETQFIEENNDPLPDLQNSELAETNSLDGYEGDGIFDKEDDEKPFSNNDNVQCTETGQVKKSYSCSYCEKKFYSKINLQLHIKVHKGDSPFECPLCHKRFAFGANLYRHFKAAHKQDTEESVLFCAKLLQELNASENGSIVFTGESPKPYKCSVCLKTFQKLYRVKEHVRVHTGQKPYKCSVCSKQFTTSDILYRHIQKVHNRSVSTMKDITVQPKLEVKEEDRNDDNMRTVIEIGNLAALQALTIPAVSEETPQLEEENEISFLNNRNTTNLVAITTEDGSQLEPGQTYYIDLASLRNTEIFNQLQLDQIQSIQLQNSSQNEEIDVQQEIEHSIPQQTESLPQEQTLEEDYDSLLIDTSMEDADFGHAVEYTDAFQCSICGLSFSTSVSLNKHIDTHNVQLPIKCTICSKSFKGESFLKRHMLIHNGEKKFKCPFCPKAYLRQYLLNNHLRSHTGERPYSCSICQKTFAISDHLYRHLFKMHKGEGYDQAADSIRQIREINRQKKFGVQSTDFVNENIEVEIWHQSQ